MIACTILATRSGPSSGAASAIRAGDLALAFGVALAGPLDVLDDPRQRRSTCQQVGEGVVHLVDQATVEGDGVEARPGHPDVGRLLLVARAVGALELDQAVSRVERPGAEVGLEDPQAEPGGPDALDHVEQRGADTR